MAGAHTRNVARPAPGPHSLPRRRVRGTTPGRIAMRRYRGPMHDTGRSGNATMSLRAIAGRGIPALRFGPFRSAAAPGNRSVASHGPSTRHPAGTCLAESGDDAPTSGKSGPGGPRAGGNPAFFRESDPAPPDPVSAASWLLRPHIQPRAAVAHRSSCPRAGLPRQTPPPPCADSG
jgi:hypothetical protein